MAFWTTWEPSIEKWRDAIFEWRANIFINSFKTNEQDEARKLIDSLLADVRGGLTKVPSQLYKNCFFEVAKSFESYKQYIIHIAWIPYYEERNISLFFDVINPPQNTREKEKDFFSDFIIDKNKREKCPICESPSCKLGIIIEGKAYLHAKCENCGREIKEEKVVKTTENIYRNNLKEYFRAFREKIVNMARLRTQFC